MNSGEATKKKATTDSPVVEDGDNLSEFVRHLDSVNVNNPDAKPNETSMGDGKGKRITFNEEHLRNKTFKGIEVPRKPYKKI